MPVPVRHISRLNAQIRNHRAKIARLQAELRKPLPAIRARQARNELSKHRLAVDLGTDPQLIPALNEILDNPQARAVAMANPTAYARSKGVKIPARARITVREFSPRIRVEVSGGIAGVEFSFGYDSDDGFFGDIDKD